MADNPQTNAGRARAEMALTEKAFATMRENALEDIAQSKASECELRENLYRTIQVIDTIKKHLRSIIEDGQVEKFADAIRKQSGLEGS